jgi:hypothetical protein
MRSKKKPCGMVILNTAYGGKCEKVNHETTTLPPNHLRPKRKDVLMDEKIVRDDLDYLKHIINAMRTAPHKQVNSGVLVAEILVDSIDAWTEFLQDIAEAAEKQQ